jgi:hypothetical protein
MRARHRGIREGRGGIVAKVGTAPERRKHQRFQVKHSMSFKIGRKTLTGRTVNACDQGMLVESSVSSRTALKIFKMFRDRPNYRSEAEFTFGQDVYLRDVEVKHFRFDFSGSEPYRLSLGFWLPPKKAEAHQNGRATRPKRNP